VADSEDILAFGTGHVDLVARDIRGAILKDLNLMGRDLSRSLMEKSKFDSCNLEGCNFNKCKLEDAKFTNCIIKNTNFSHILALNVKFEKCDLRNCFFNDSGITQFDFVDCDVRGADFSGRDFTRLFPFDKSMSDFDTKFDNVSTTRELAKNDIFRYYDFHKGILIRKIDIEFANEDSTKEKLENKKIELLILLREVELQIKDQIWHSTENSNVKPGIGHNNPPIFDALELEEIEKTANAISTLSEEFNKTEPDSSKINSAEKIITATVIKVGNWVAEKANLFSDEFSKNLGADLGKVRNIIALWALFTGKLTQILEVISNLSY
jgi:RNAse (barnase) inhibitor barstar